MTLFDSTGLAIQDLAIASAAYAAWRAGAVLAVEVELVSGAVVAAAPEPEVPLAGPGAGA